MYLNNNYRNAIQWAISRLSAVHTEEESQLYQSLCDLLEGANKAAIKNAEHSKSAMEKYRNNPDNKERLREEARLRMRRYRATKK